MLTHTSVPERVAWRGLALLALFMLVAPLLLLASSRSADAAFLCLPSQDQACIQSTLRSEKDVVADVKIVLETPSGETQETTTNEDGVWAFTVTETGKYVVSIDEDTLPKGLNIETGKVSVNVPTLNVTKGATLSVRTTSYSSGTSTFDDVLQSIYSGVRLGLLLALAAVGLSLIYGTTGISNFAHAEQVTLGGILGYGLVNVAGLSLWVGGVLVVLIGGFTGWFQDRVLWQPLRHRGLGLTQLMIVTIGLSLAMQYSFQYFVGSATHQVIIESPTVREIGPLTVTDRSLVAMAICLVALAGVGYALLRTRVGRATRAVSDNPALAQASGIDTDKVVRLVWTVAMALAALSGILFALINNGIKWDTGLQILLLLFAAVTLGGLGTAFGALLGALVIGLIVELAHFVIPGDFKYAAALLILILLLLVRPQGLLGRAQRVG
jgi:neutral amino acid transport system permease protein